MPLQPSSVLGHIQDNLYAPLTTLSLNLFFSFFLLFLSLTDFASLFSNEGLAVCCYEDTPNPVK